MPVTKTLAEHLAGIGRELRGWDTPGSLSQLQQCAGRNECDVAMAWIRFCADPNVKHPGAFPNLKGPHWAEKVGAITATRNPLPHEECPQHPGQFWRSCAYREPCGTPVRRGTQPPSGTGPTPEYLEARKR